MLTSFLVAITATLLPASALYGPPVDGFSPYRLSDGCGIETGFDDGTRIAVQIAMSSQQMTNVLLTNPAWTSLAVGQIVPVTVKLGRNSYPVNARVLVQNGTKALAFGVPRPEMMKAMIVDHAGLWVTYGERTLFAGSVGATNAGTLLVHCIDGLADPFKK